METRRSLVLRPFVLPWIGWEIPARTPGNEGQAFSVARAGGGMPVETKKARSVVALSRVPRGERGAPVRLRLPVTVARSEGPSAAPLERDAGLSVRRSDRIN